MLQEKLLKRFSELQYKSFGLESYRHSDGIVYFQRSSWLSWAIDAQVLIKAVFNEQSPYYIEFVRAKEGCVGNTEQIKVLLSIFKNAKEAFQGGYIFDVERTISGEILGDFVSLAKEAFSSGYKDVAAVLASAALEDALKRYAKVNGLEVEDKSMTEIVNALKSGRLVSGASKTLLEAMPSIRNNAQHARWDRIDEPSVSGMISYVEQFLLTEFSP